MKAMWTRSVILFLVISLVLHFAFYGGLSFWSSLIPPAPPKPIEVTLLETPSSTDNAKKESLDSALPRQIVEQDQRVNDEIDKNAKYLGKFDQKVLSETRADRSGRFQNRVEQGQEGKSQTLNDALETPSKPTTESASIKEPPTAPSKNPSRPQKGLRLKDLPQGEQGLQAFKPDFRPRLNPQGQEGNSGKMGQASQTDDYLKDVNKGVQTLLSTREFVYYAYYSRIKEKLRIHWEPRVRERVRQLIQQGRSLASQDRITKILIILNPQGQLIRIEVLGQSGVEDLDQAAMEAFRASAPFPNPPKGIVEEDGTIKIRWDFVLEA